jgi:hypothetical protein
LSSDRKRILAEWVLGIGLFFQHIAPCAMVVVAYGKPAMEAWTWAGGVWVGSSIITIWGACLFMQVKGWHPAWGMFGLAGLFGVVVMACLKDREGSRAFEVLPAKHKPEEYD